MRMIAVDQTGVFFGMREAVRVTRKQKGGAIVNISSIWVVQRSAALTPITPSRERSAT